MMMKQEQIPYDLIRDHYECLTPQIVERYEHRKAGWISPYCHGLDWSSLFSPIEEITWQVLRSFGLCPMYPQYPAGKYFLDFAHPGAKVVIECDGHDYHLDKKKDLQRDKSLSELGWIVYRIPGKDCFRQVHRDYMLVDSVKGCYRSGILADFYQTTIEGLVKAIAVRHFGYRNIYKDEYTDELSIINSALDNRISKSCIWPIDHSSNILYDANR